MDYQALIEMAVLAGEIMLVSGAEVYRIEDTVSRILKQSGLEGIEFSHLQREYLRRFPILRSAQLQLSRE